VACREEHPLLVQLKGAKIVPVVGLDYKDQRPVALKFLSQNGDPYDLSAFDGDGRVGIDYGVYGVPETFIIDKNGIIRHKQIGPITPESLEKTILPLIEKLKQS
jgi:cytochrome c biogenesis protein CcmG/thiol:disulfide interchange protein DsbE